MRADALRLIEQADPNDADAVFKAAVAATKNGAEEAAVPLLELAKRRHAGDPRIWQMLGLAHRNLQNLRPALQALKEANTLSPHDPLIAHSLARATLEAGLPAIELFERAHRLAPLEASVLLGRAAAQFAAGRTQDAIEGLDAQLAQHPGWVQGHSTAARLRWMSGRRADFTRSYLGAVAKLPRNGQLWRELVTTLLHAEMIEEALAAIARARSTLGPSRTLDGLEASARSEQGDLSHADRLFSTLLPLNEIGLLVRYARHLLQAGRPEQVALIGDVPEGQGNQLLPYISVAWRLTQDTRWEWLEGDPRFVQVYDLGEQLGSLEALAARLRTLHLATHQPLEQSLRGGTQTDGPLLSRIDPEIEELRGRLMDAVQAYLAQLPSDRSHPFLCEPREPLRMAGSWSVRLTDGGRHVNHVHSAGWISSAFYVSLPQAIGGDDHAGWFSAGEVGELGLDLPPLYLIEPKPGRLVLFPSTMWHGTRPFSAGERLTIAFDIARPPK